MNQNVNNEKLNTMKLKTPGHRTQDCDRNRTRDLQEATPKRSQTAIIPELCHCGWYDDKPWTCYENVFFTRLYIYQ